MSDTFDFVVVGAGSGGCAVAGRLSEDASTSVALLDACRMLEQPLIEVHLSNPHSREHFRRRSFISQAATGVICGLHAQGYLLAIDAVAQIIKDKRA